MSKLVSASVLAALLCIGPADSLHGQDFDRADQLPMPDGGIARSDGSGLEHLGYSPSRGAILFRRYGSTEGLGGNPDIDYVFIDPSSGQIVEEIPVNVNLFAVGDPSDEEGWAELVKQNDEMAEAAEREIARISDLDDGSYADPLYGTGGVVRCINPEDLDGGPNATFRYYVMNEPTGWLKPLHESGEYAFDPEAVGFARARLTGGGKMLMLEYFRSPVMEYDTGTQIFLVLSTEQTAQYFNEVGFAYYGLKDYDSALTAFQLALNSFPDFAKAAYNAACMAALLRDVDSSLRFLGELARIRVERVDDYAVAAGASLQQVDKDSDFNGIRSNPAFVSGLKRIRGK